MRIVRIAAHKAFPVPEEAIAKVIAWYNEIIGKLMTTTGKDLIPSVDEIIDKRTELAAQSITFNPASKEKVRIYGGTENDFQTIDLSIMESALSKNMTISQDSLDMIRTTLSQVVPILVVTEEETPLARAEVGPFAGGKTGNPYFRLAVYVKSHEPPLPPSDLDVSIRHELQHIVDFTHGLAAGKWEAVKNTKPSIVNKTNENATSPAVDSRRDKKVNLMRTRDRQLPYARRPWETRAYAEQQARAMIRRFTDWRNRYPTAEEAKNVSGEYGETIRQYLRKETYAPEGANRKEFLAAVWQNIISIGQSLVGQDYKQSLFHQEWMKSSRAASKAVLDAKAKELVKKTIEQVGLPNNNDSTTYAEHVAWTNHFWHAARSICQPVCTPRELQPLEPLWYRVRAEMHKLMGGDPFDKLLDRQAAQTAKRHAIDTQARNLVEKAAEKLAESRPAHPNNRNNDRLQLAIAKAGVLWCNQCVNMARSLATPKELENTELMNNMPEAVVRMLGWNPYEFAERYKAIRPVRKKPAKKSSTDFPITVS